MHEYHAAHLVYGLQIDDTDGAYLEDRLAVEGVHFLKTGFAGQDNLTYLVAKGAGYEAALGEPVTIEDMPRMSDLSREHDRLLYDAADQVGADVLKDPVWILIATSQ